MRRRRAPPSVRRVSLRVLVVLLGVAASLTAPPAVSSAHAAAGDDAHAVAVSIPAVAPGAYERRTVECPAGERAIGGGIGFVSTAGVGAVMVRESWPFTSLDGVATGWVSAISNHTKTPQSFTAYAICSASSDAVVRATEFTTKFDGGSHAPCLAGEQAIGGGVAPVKRPTPAYVQVNGPVDETGQAVSTDDGDVPRSWYVAVRHLANTGLTFDAIAVCSPTSRTTLQATAFVVDKGESGQATALCPPGQRALSGGLGTTGGRWGMMGFSGPTDANGTPLGAAGGVAAGWTVDVYNLNPASETYKVFVVCEAPAPAPTPAPAPGTPAPTPPAEPGGGGQPAADAAVEADVVGVKSARSLIGLRVVRLQLELGEPVSVTLALVRKGKTLARKRFASVKPGRRTLTLAVPPRVGARSAALRYELEDAAGNTLSARRSVKIPRFAK